MGEIWYEQGDNTSLKFTTYWRDSETGLDYAIFRYHASALGRFQTPDPIGGSIRSPQSLNRYSYVRNDPVNLVDPLGLLTCVEYELRCEGNICQVVCKKYQDDVVVTANPDDIGGDDTLATTFWEFGMGDRRGRFLGGFWRALCASLPEGRTTGIGGGGGLIGGQTGTVEQVLNYNTGQTTLFVSGGNQWGWNGGVYINAFSGFIYNLGSSNTNYSGGFTTVHGSVPVGATPFSAGGFAAASGKGMPFPSAPTSGPRVVGATGGASLIPTPTGTVSATNYVPILSSPVPLSPSALDRFMMAARQLCND